MKLRIMIVALGLATLPQAALAMCTDRHQQASQCAEGETRDAATGACTKAVHG